MRRTSPFLIALFLSFSAFAQSDYDAAIVDYVGLKYPCDGEVVPTLRIQNQGTNTMFTCVVETWKNGIPSNSFNWVLAAPAPTGVTRQPALPVVTGVLPGDLLEFRIISVNAVTDEDATDNIRMEAIDGSSELSASYQVKVEVFTDGDPQETTWKILNDLGAVVAQGGPYADPNVLVEQWATLNASDCFNFKVEDSGGNGMDQRSLPGYVKVIGLGNEVINVGGSDFSDSFEEGLRTGADACGVTGLTNTADPVISCGDGIYFGEAIHASAVPGANKYQWEFTRPNYLRRIATATPSLTVVKWSQKPLQPGRSYNVRVRSSLDNGTTWCPYGATCSIYLAYTPGTSPRDMEEGALELMDLGVDVFPNPGHGQEVMARFTGLNEGMERVDLQLFDLQGRVLTTRSFDAMEEEVQQLRFDAPLQPGLYVLRASAGARSVTTRLVVE